MPQLAMGAVAGLKSIGAGIFGGAGAGAAASGAAASAATTTAATSGSLLSGANFLTGVKMLGTIGSGLSAMRQANAAADEAELQASAERNQTENRALQRKRELLAVMGENEAAFAAAGVDASTGLAADTARQAKQNVDNDLTIERRDLAFRNTMSRRRASALRAGGRSGFTGALLTAAGQGASQRLSLKRLGA